MKGLTKWLGLAKVEIDKHGPEILTGLGVAGMFAAVIFSIQATPKATKAIEKKKNELNKEKLSAGEIVSASWKYYVPSAIALATSTTCVICANSVSTRRNAALAAAYSISETALSEYKAKVRDTIGERKEESIQSDIARDKVLANPPSQTTIIATGKGDTLFMDDITKQPFRSDIEKIRKIENDLNREMRSTMTISLNDVYSALGLPVYHKVYDTIGWDVDRQPLEFIFRPVIDENNNVCIVLCYRYDPEPIV